MPLLDQDTQMRIMADVFMFSMAEAGMQLASGASLNDPSFVYKTVMILLGFATYQALVRRLVEPYVLSRVGGNTQVALATFFKVATMMGVVQLLRGGALADPMFIKESGAVLAGFAAFDLFGSGLVGRYVSGSPRMQQAMLLSSKFAVMFAVSQLLLRQPFTPEFVRRSLGYIAGIAAYVFVVA